MRKNVRRHVIGLSLTLLWMIIVSNLAAQSDPFQLGMTLEELNQALLKTGSSGTVFKEDLAGFKIVLPYSPLKSVEITGGEVSTVFLMKKSEGNLGLGQLFGYLYEGKLFCRTQLFKDSPLFPSHTLVSDLKKKYPEGTISRNLTGPTPFSYFEYLTKGLYVFSNEQGAYTCDPVILSRVVRATKKEIGAREARELDTMRESMRAP